ncbi:MAG: valine--tRNA ligase [Acidobacteria bacterium]|nr:MAG: valine--tRNA ligase [Acidobacteriota bacterium]REK02294.1 MAG: valine--tRNA ligase [Acidobacteriota bacterium]REK13903.1 MAG: valine--tRNA ligase [Acidobacteriota bacterium]REK41897.1 MAG: valine--tRNA ligase [Acidobacteriota bacterium]
MELSKQYDPAEAEKKHYEYWESNGLFSPEINGDENAPKYSIVIPPPNVTGSLHMGHALQHTLMDVLTRRKRMLGFRTLFLPGIDHAGISTQKMVTDKLWKEERKTPQDIGREEFTKRVWEWKEKYGGTILQQMRREGISVDWTRERFTMEDSLSNAVTSVFVALYEEGAIYRGARIVNWCPNDKTVLSDLEVQDQPKKDGKLYYLKYPVKGTSKFLTVATTRPETMLGDTAVAVNPEDDRFRDLVGATVKLPLTGREIPVIADEYVDAEFGTGAVKITPAHDPNDYELGLRHSLPQLNVMNDDATMNAEAGAEFEGLDRFKARKLVVEKFEELGLLEKIDEYEIILPVCERCKTVIETLISEQWWVRMAGMRDLALNLKNSDDLPKFTPHNPHTKVYTDWLENLRDWTISRQLWWGHQIPAWYDDEGNVYVANSSEEASEKAGGKELVQEEDVLDTWFSSWIWSFSTLGWQKPGDLTEDMAAFHPTDVLITARDIIFLWVSRMVMSSLNFVDERPFDDVYITGTVLASDGQRMSKTKGNGVDPLDVFDKYGVDATRMTLAGSSTGMDFAWRDEKVESFRNFANKIWNATRFCLMNSEGAAVDVASIANPDSIADRWIVSRLNRTAKRVNEALEKYAFHESVQLLYHFFWDDFCDWYIELSKDEITGGDAEARTRILTVLEQSLRLLHPFMPYLTEELWQKLPGTGESLHGPAYSGKPVSISLATFPIGEEALIDDIAESEMALVIDLITKVRNIRSEMQIKPSDRIPLHIAAEGATRSALESNEAQIAKLARASEIVFGSELNVPRASAKAVLSDGSEIAVPLEGLIDFEKELERLSGQIGKLEAEEQKLRAQLDNKNFVERAPEEKVSAVRDRVGEIDVQLAALRENFAALDQTK